MEDQQQVVACKSLTKYGSLVTLAQKNEFDNGGEFKVEFRELTMNIGLKTKESLAWNPQSNTILERIHQVLADCLV